jgi:hypothetical protein
MEWWRPICIRRLVDNPQELERILFTTNGWGNHPMHDLIRLTATFGIVVLYPIAAWVTVIYLTLRLMHWLF